MLGKFHLSVLTLLAIEFFSPSVMAQSLNEVRVNIENEAKKESPAFQSFSAARGESFFKTKHGNEWSCSSCHTSNPAALGKHAKTSKDIQPLAPSANAERFSNQSKVDKWFKRNCKDVLDRVCSAQEKGDVLAYLMTVKK
jgi:Domain of unknown function (DUF1924)